MKRSLLPSKMMISRERMFSLWVHLSTRSLGDECHRVIAPYAQNDLGRGVVAKKRHNAVDVALDAIPSGFGASKPIIHIDVVEMDTTDSETESIRTAAASINAQDLPIDVLLSTVMVPQSHQLWYNTEGYELQFADNYLGTFLPSRLAPSPSPSSGRTRVTSGASLEQGPYMVPDSMGRSELHIET